jgi:hypothetical protein
MKEGRKGGGREGRKDQSRQHGNGLLQFVGLFDQVCALANATLDRRKPIEVEMVQNHKGSATAAVAAA